MRTIMKVLGGVLVALLIVVAVIAWMVMGGQQPMAQRQEIVPGVTQIKDGFVGVGMIRTESGKIVLIDAGNDPAAKAIMAELDERHLKADDVWAIFLTHGHPDHRKGVAAFPKANVYILPADMDLVMGKVKPLGPLPRLFPLEDDHVKITKAVHDGDTVTYDGVQVRVFELPGHTAGSAAYLVSGVLFLGDGANFSKYGRLTGPKWIFSDDTSMAANSLRTLAHRLAPIAAEIKAVVTSHSGASTNGLTSLTSFAEDK